MQIFCFSTELRPLVWQGVVCAHMPCFRRPGHKYREKGIMPVSPAHYNKQLH